jgi:hypothetical protein
VSPAANIPSRCSTASRCPRMMGFPPKIFGSTTIRRRRSSSLIRSSLQRDGAFTLDKWHERPLLVLPLVSAGHLGGAKDHSWSSTTAGPTKARRAILPNPRTEEEAPGAGPHRSRVHRRGSVQSWPSARWSVTGRCRGRAADSNGGQLLGAQLLPSARPTHQRAYCTEIDPSGGRSAQC